MSRPDVKGSRRPCVIPGCPKDTQTDDPRCHWCREGRKAHLAGERAPEPITEHCCGPRCDRPVRVKGMCWGHYSQMKRHGRVGVLNRYQRRTTPRQEAA